MNNKTLLRIKQLVSLAEQALNTAQGNLASGDFRATVNRAYLSNGCWNI